jgi:hypothetical protein
MAETLMYLIQAEVVEVMGTRSRQHSQTLPSLAGMQALKVLLFLSQLCQQ